MHASHGENTGQTKVQVRARVLAFGLLSILFVGLIGLQIWLSLRYQQKVQSVVKDLQSLQSSILGVEKTRQEMISLRIENEQKGILFQSFFTNLSITVGIVAALSGAWMGVYQYLGIREKEQQDRTKERLDRSAGDLAELWQGIANNDSKVRASSIAGLSHFLTPDKQEFHGRVASALALAGRLDDNNGVVLSTLTPIVEYAFREFPETMRSVSWQGLKLKRPNFSGLDLSHFDFRDSDLSGGDFSSAKLGGARFDAARLISANLDGADCSGARFEYTDLASASMKGAMLRGANLRHIKILHADFSGADMREASLSEHTTDWRISKNWRSARFDGKVHDSLTAKFDPPTSGPRILMLLWEFPPAIAGGTWTAAYHFLKNLRKAGANIVVLVPWGQVSYDDFGNEIEVIPVGPVSATNNDPYSAYSGVSNKQGTSFVYDAYCVSASLFEKMEQFVVNCREYIKEKDLRFDIIHAQDWISCEAAEAISSDTGKPWVAHLHSLEADRREEPSEGIRTRERQACMKANHIVVPSGITKARVMEFYEIPSEKISVVPNCLSHGERHNLSVGEFQTKRIVYLGRIGWQKGTDYFVDLARLAYGSPEKMSFEIFGRGDSEHDMKKRQEMHRLLVPEPLEIDPQEEGEGSVEFRTMEEITYKDPVGQTLPSTIDMIEGLGIRRLHSPVESRRRKQLALFAYATGYTAYPVRISGYTHRIHLNSAYDEGGAVDYLVNAYGLMQISEESNDSVSFRDHLEWRKRRTALEAATVCVVPSRNEPYGMVILEAMQAGVPVIYTESAGAGEVLHSGIRIKLGDLQHALNECKRLVSDYSYWKHVVAAQDDEIRSYATRGYENKLMEIWRDILG